MSCCRGGRGGSSIDPFQRPRGRCPRCQPLTISTENTVVVALPAVAVDPTSGLAVAAGDWIGRSVAVDVLRLIDQLGDQPRAAREDVQGGDLAIERRNSRTRRDRKLQKAIGLWLTGSSPARSVPSPNSASSDEFREVRLNH